MRSEKLYCVVYSELIEALFVDGKTRIGKDEFVRKLTWQNWLLDSQKLRAKVKSLIDNADAEERMTESKKWIAPDFPELVRDRFDD